MDTTALAATVTSVPKIVFFMAASIKSFRSCRGRIAQPISVNKITRTFHELLKGLVHVDREGLIGIFYRVSPRTVPLLPRFVVWALDVRASVDHLLALEAWVLV